MYYNRLLTRDKHWLYQEKYCFKELNHCLLISLEYNPFSFQTPRLLFFIAGENTLSLLCNDLVKFLPNIALKTKGSMLAPNNTWNYFPIFYIIIIINANILWSSFLKG